MIHIGRRPGLLHADTVTHVAPRSILLRADFSIDRMQFLSSKNVIHVLLRICGAQPMFYGRIISYRSLLAEVLPAAPS